jgi:hypothetical protein
MVSSLVDRKTASIWPKRTCHFGHILAPKKNQQNYNWQRYTQQPKQCAASQSHCLSPSSLMCRAKHPRWILSSLRARKFLRRIPRGPRAQGAKIEPGQTYLWLRAAQRGGGVRDAALAEILPRKIEGLMASTYILPNRARITTTTRTVPSTPPGA